MTCTFNMIILSELFSYTWQYCVNDKAVSGLTKCFFIVCSPKLFSGLFILTITQPLLSHSPFLGHLCRPYCLFVSLPRNQCGFNLCLYFLLTGPNYSFSVSIFSYTFCLCFQFLLAFNTCGF